MTKKIWELTGKEHEAIFQEAVKEAIAKAHAAGFPTTHMDEKGIYQLFPDGRKVYEKGEQTK
ncbi:MAG: hypothetical protein E6X17_15165 [Sporomusaceae bacterium]|nr:hypothetical protein [Sporomusaceae bacterium]